MVCNMHQTAIILLVILLSTTTYAFQQSFSCISKVLLPLHKTKLNLIPEQGSQLITAYVAMYQPSHEEIDFFRQISVLKTANQREDHVTVHLLSNPTITHTTHAARTLLSRIFRGKSYQEPDLSEWNKFHSKNDVTKEGGDVVYYPIVGFRWVSIEEEQGRRYKVLPTVSAAACTLAHGKALKENVVGWFSPACVLKSTYL